MRRARREAELRGAAAGAAPSRDGQAAECVKHQVQVPDRAGPARGVQALVGVPECVLQAPERAVQLGVHRLPIAVRGALRALACWCLSCTSPN